jgi:flagellar secretion chaperone FliS
VISRNGAEVIGDPYKRYVENSTIAADPVGLVVTLYERAIECTRICRACLQSGDVWGRSKAVANAMSILIELRASLNPNVGAEIGKNLDRLYHYMQTRLSHAHAKQADEAFFEVERLLQNLLEAWYMVARSARQMDHAQEFVAVTPEMEEAESPYHAYLAPSVLMSEFAEITG